MRIEKEHTEKRVNSTSSPITSIMNARNYLTRYNQKKRKESIKRTGVVCFLCLMLEGFFNLFFWKR